MKMGRRPRCSSVTYRFRYAPLLAPCRRPILIATKAMLFRGQGTRLIDGLLLSKADAKRLLVANCINLLALSSIEMLSQYSNQNFGRARVHD